MTIEEILRLSQEKRASDIHLSPGSPLMFRIDGEMVPQTDYHLTPEETWGAISYVMSEDDTRNLKEAGELDFAFSLPGLFRVRVNVFSQRGTYAAALRILSFETPTPEKLAIPHSVVQLTHKKRGLVLVTGATGSGKSTTLASLIGEISGRDAKNIITLEDPIEYLHPHKRCIVSQREIGSDTTSYAAALKAALREDPDVILVGEMRDLETIAIAITAAAAYEVMIATHAIRNLIREGKTYQIPSLIQTGKKDGMQSMDDAIYELYVKGRIDEETALRHAFSFERMKQRIGRF